MRHVASFEVTFEIIVIILLNWNVQVNSLSVLRYFISPRGSLMWGCIAFSWRGANVMKWILFAQAKIQNGCFKRSAHADCRSSLQITNVYDICVREYEKGLTFKDAFEITS